MIDRSHQFHEVMEPRSGIQELVGPVYGTSDKSNYFVIQPRPDRITGLDGPVYNIEETKHHFNELNKAVESVKTLAGPVYDVDSSHKFQEMEHIVADLKMLQGPVYSIENAHSFAEIEKSVDNFH